MNGLLGMGEKRIIITIVFCSQNMHLMEWNRMEIYKRVNAMQNWLNSIISRKSKLMQMVSILNNMLEFKIHTSTYVHRFTLSPSIYYSLSRCLSLHQLSMP